MGDTLPATGAADSQPAGELLERCPVLRIIGITLHLLEVIWGWQQLSQRRGIPFAFPGQDRIAARLGVSTRTVRNHLRTLEAAGLLA